MAYKITFKGSERKACYEWTDQEKQVGIWKKSKLILDEIIIKPSGRNIRSKPWKKDVIYTLYDYGIFLAEKKVPLEIIVVCDNVGNPVDMVIPWKIKNKVEIRSSVQETVDAIILADKEYRGRGGVLYKKQFHKDHSLIVKLFSLLNSIKDR